MKQIKTSLIMGILMFCSSFIFNGCKTPPATYCSFAVRSRTFEGCTISKDVTKLCFICDSKRNCPNLAMKHVKITFINKTTGKTDSCTVSLGNKITECEKCAEGDSIVVLGRVLD